MTKEQATREALELALDALKEFGEHYDWCHQFPTYAFPENYPPCNCGYDEAITAIKEALANHIEDNLTMVAQPEQELTNLERHERNVQRLFGTPQPKEPEQEPVAYGMWDTMIGCGGRMMYVRLDKGQDGCTVPLYTTPPQRKPLTREVIERDFQGRVDFVRQVEAAHGIKE